MTTKTKKPTWDAGQRIAVLCATDDDKGFEANKIVCPVCKKETLQYDRTSMFDMTAWCSTCETGLKQGDGSANAKP